jgi:hypothetical protein
MLMSLNSICPVSGNCKHASVRINDDLPAPLGPNKPTIPDGKVREIFLNAWVPSLYVLFRLFIVNIRKALKWLLFPKLKEGGERAPAKND